jgi:opioid growth factor receptor-like protein
LDEQQIAAFRASDELRVRLLKSLNTMLSFYGLQCEDTREGSRITKADSFELKKGNWLTRSNHNYLRITRILMSLQLLSLQEYAGAFLRFLEQLYKENSDRIGETTLQYWKRAVVL